jgi:hypothetical protein
LRKRAVTSDVNSPINRALELADVFAWDDCCEWLTAEHFPRAIALALDRGPRQEDSSGPP